MTFSSEASSDMSSYQTACEEDPDLWASDSSLQARTTTAINSVPVTLDHPDLIDLVKEYLENSCRTMNFFTSLQNSLQRAYHSQSILKNSLQKFEEESAQIKEPTGLYSKTLEELKKFKDASDPFRENFFSLFHSVYRQQESMLKNLKEKKSRLDKKLHRVKYWKRIYNVILAAVFVSVPICSVVAAAFTVPPVVTALVAAASSVPLGAMGKWLNTKWKKYQDDLKWEREILTGIGAENFILIKDLENVKVLVDKLQNHIQELLYSANFAMDQSEAVGTVIV